jgi:cyclopropane-fatty-acyl-phospholipid synthase
MIEAVGWQYFDTFFERCGTLLAPDGTMLLQAITIDDRAYAVEKATKSFANTHIFPGGCLPSVEVISRSVARASDLRAVHLEDITHHYVRTLRCWRANFLGQRARVQALGYDGRFQRLWELYLAYCEGGFDARRIGTVQLLLAKPRHVTGRRLAVAGPGTAATGLGGGGVGGVRVFGAGLTAAARG